MVTIYDIMEQKELVSMVQRGYVRVQVHPAYPYNIACYTKQAMFDRMWNDVTLNCRGLIYHQETGEILARPFKKFFNYGEPNAPEFGVDDWVTVYDKVDGSLGIAYETPDGPAIATKGSFTSDQALHATDLLRAKYPMYEQEGNITDLFEIVYPENRIVLDYGDMDDLIYLGSVDIETGEDYWNSMYTNFVCGIPKNHFMLQGTWPDVIQLIDLHRPNSEGVVLLNEFTGDRLKLKQEDYLELHKVMTGLNERQLWEWLSQGKEAWQILSELPEELHSWAEPLLSNMVDQFNSKRAMIVSAYCGTDPTDERRFFAAYAKQYPPWITHGLFIMLDTTDYVRLDEHVWKQVKP